MNQSPISSSAQNSFPIKGKNGASESESGEILGVVPETNTPTDTLADTPTEPPTDWRINAVRIGALLIITLGSCWLAFNPEWVRSFGRWGYLSVFFVSLLSSATVLIPAPGLAVVFAMGAALNPITLGVVAGIGSGLGELSGYIAGASGRGLILRNKGINGRLHWFTTRYTFPALFVLAILPLPVFDLAGVIAGAMKMRVSHFLAVVISGKVIKHVLVAMMGAGSLGVFRHLLGL